jgi:hypothetical protein
VNKRRNDLETAPLINVGSIFKAKHISDEKGRKVVADLKAEGRIDPTETTTGRCLVSIRDALVLGDAL